MPELTRFKFRCPGCTTGLTIQVPVQPPCELLRLDRLGHVNALHTQLRHHILMDGWHIVDGVATCPGCSGIHIRRLP